MIFEFEGIYPDIDEKTFIAEGAQVTGAVRMMEYSSLWHNTVARGDVNRIEIGRYSNVQDNSVLHVADDSPTIIGDYVTVGHGAILHGCVVNDHCLIGMGAVILNNAIIGRGSIVAAGCVIREGMIIPEYSLVAGVPAKIIKTLPEKIENIHAQAVKYKYLWSVRYNIMPDCGGEIYNGEKII